ncbi:aldehyde dehydrogenase family protein [Nocardia sp. SYP-A9097]|uniref:aldehyde dehydrogenase family protein n=1 Tax=Nocardia sp. SYP-A9097 TaxID=2663237 RepID=UPI002814E60C|nr:aldehyde dehydrogenase family protein [Nocardia sp. SYP-A9097]
MSIDRHSSATATVDVQNPATGAVVGSVPLQTADAVQAVVRELRSRQPAWEALGSEGRAAWLRKLRNWLLDNESRLVEELHAETSKPRAEAVLEVMMICDAINYYSDRARKFLADERPRPHGLLTVQKKLTQVYRPYPVVGIISPWNFPLMIPGVDAVPALLAGAAVVIKPSEVTPMSGLGLARGWREIGAPPVLACVTGRGETGAAVVDSVDMVQFTGSTRTGRAIAARAGERLIPCSVELGGKDPAIVLADADLVRAANGIAWGGLVNSGQACISVERVYVEASVYDRFLELLAERVSALRQGLDDGCASADIGALATVQQAEIVRGHVDDALARGAGLLTGSIVRDTGMFVEPTILVDVDHSMACMREETFGPTIPVMRVADAEEAIRLANDCEYGLSATVWTKDRARGEAIARRLEVGSVNINDAYANLFCFALPQGGWKNSGLGSRLGGAQGVRKYCRRQAITAPRVRPPKNEVLWYPYSPRRARTVAKMLRLLAARNVRRRLFRG